MEDRQPFSEEAGSSPPRFSHRNDVSMHSYERIRANALENPRHIRLLDQDPAAHTCPRFAVTENPLVSTIAHSAQEDRALLTFLNVKVRRAHVSIR